MASARFIIRIYLHNFCHSDNGILQSFAQKVGAIRTSFAIFFHVLNYLTHVLVFLVVIATKLKTYIFNLTIDFDTLIQNSCKKSTTLTLK